MNVLIAEDDRLIAHELAHTVAALGHDVVALVSSRAEAAEMLRGAGPQAALDLALIDLHLADGFTGHDLAADLEARRVAVAFLTGHADQLPLEDHPRPVLEKPYFDGSVRRVLDLLTAKRRQAVR